MTIDGKTAILRTRHRLETRVGHSNKERHAPLVVAMALRHLEDRGGTIDFDTQSEEALSIGLRTAYHKIAYDMALGPNLHPLAKPTIIDRCQSVSHARMIASAFQAIRRHLRDDHVYPLFILPRWFGSKVIEVITIQPDYLVNAGQTASELAMARGNRDTKEFIRRVKDRHQLMTGTVEGWTTKFHELVEEIGRESFLRPLLNFDASPEAQ